MIERDVSFTRDGGRVPAVLWLPDAGQARALIVAGHGYTLDKRALFPPSLAADLTARGLALAAVDAPGHGERQPDGGRDRAAVDAAWRAHWRRHAAAEIAKDYGILIDRLAADSPLGGVSVGYWGLSLGTQYGIGVLAAEQRIRAAVLGLFGLPDPAPRMAAYAAGVTCPVFFIRQSGDEVHMAERVQTLFDALASNEKTLVTSPGAHVDVPREVFERAYDFLAARLTPP